MTLTGTPSVLDVDVTVVVGPMRTGTTLVARTLDSHPEVAYLGFELAEQWAAWTGLPFGAPGADDISCPPIGDDDATRERVAGVRDGLTRILHDHTRRTGRRPRMVVLKNPHLWHRIPFVLAVLPHARLIRTHRDLRAVVASLRRLWERSLEQHGRVHHLPRDPRRCWDFVPAGHANAYEPSRTFPGGDIATLAEFVARVESRLDAVATTASRRLVVPVTHRQLVEDFEATTERLQRALDLEPTSLRSPEALDASRLHEWRQLLGPDEIAALAR